MFVTCLLRLTCFILSISLCVFYKYGSIWPTEVLEKAETLFVCMCQFLTSIESVTWSQLPFHNKSHNSYTIGTSSIWTKEVSCYSLLPHRLLQAQYDKIHHKLGYACYYGDMLLLWWHLWTGDMVRSHKDTPYL